eukprot:2069749-Alexandrium_andersonii.AAC.1
MRGGKLMTTCVRPSGTVVWHPFAPVRPCRWRVAILVRPPRVATMPWAPVEIKTGPQGRPVPTALVFRGPSSPAGCPRALVPIGSEAVSYTHLTLPTICSV